jgi:hypothetical protein
MQYSPNAPRYMSSLSSRPSARAARDAPSKATASGPRARYASHRWADLGRSRNSGRNADSTIRQRDLPLVCRARPGRSLPRCRPPHGRVRLASDCEVTHQ